MANTLFDLIRVDSFMDDINREDCFDTRDMDGVTPNYKIVLASACASNIDDCIDEDGTLITPYDPDTNKGVTLIDSLGVDDGMCSMLWSRGINGERTMSIADSSVTYDLGSETYNLRAVFLVNIADGTGYVIAYSISDKVVEIDGNPIFPVNGVIWTFKYGD
jgi:hypothetical protein